MEGVIKANKFAAIDIERVNLCRLYLGVITLSDITKLSGKWIRKEAYTGKSSYRSPVSRYSKFQQKMPGPKSWRRWKQALLLWATKNGKLYHPL